MSYLARRNNDQLLVSMLTLTGFSSGKTQSLKQCLKRDLETDEQERNTNIYCYLSKSVGFG